MAIIVEIRGRDELSGVLRGLESGIIRFVGAVTSALAAIATIGFPVKAAAEFERALADVRKTTDFTAPSMGRLKKGLLELSKETNVTTTELARIAALGGQMGLGREGADGILMFTEELSRAVTALDVDADLAATAMGKLVNIFDIPMTEFGNMVAVINQMANTTTATGEQLMDVMRRMADLGGSVTFAQSAGLAATAIDLGLTPETAGTTITKIFARMKAAASEFATFMGMSTQEWIGIIEKDGVEGLRLYADQLNKIPPQIAAGLKIALTGGGRIFDFVSKIQDQMAQGSSSVFERNLAEADAEWERGTSAIKEQQTVLTSLVAQWQIFKNVVNDVMIEAGDNALRPLSRGLANLTEMLDTDAFRDSFTGFFASVVDNLSMIGSGIASIASTMNQKAVDWGIVFDIAALALVTRLLMGIVRTAQAAFLALRVALGFAPLVAGATITGPLAWLLGTFSVLLKLISGIGAALILIDLVRFVAPLIGLGDVVEDMFDSITNKFNETFGTEFKTDRQKKAIAEAAKAKEEELEQIREAEAAAEGFVRKYGDIKVDISVSKEQLDKDLEEQQAKIDEFRKYVSKGLDADPRNLSGPTNATIVGIEEVGRQITRVEQLEARYKGVGLTLDDLRAKMAALVEEQKKSNDAADLATILQADDMPYAYGEIPERVDNSEEIAAIQERINGLLVEQGRHSNQLAQSYENVSAIAREILSVWGDTAGADLFDNGQLLEYVQLSAELVSLSKEHRDAELSLQQLQAGEEGSESYIAAKRGVDELGTKLEEAKARAEALRTALANTQSVQELTNYNPAAFLDGMADNATRLIPAITAITSEFQKAAAAEENLTKGRGTLNIDDKQIANLAAQYVLTSNLTDNYRKLGETAEIAAQQAENAVAQTASQARRDVEALTQLLGSLDDMIARNRQRAGNEKQDTAIDDAANKRIDAIDVEIKRQKDLLKEKYDLFEIDLKTYETRSNEIDRLGEKEKKSIKDVAALKKGERDVQQGLSRFNQDAVEIRETIELIKQRNALMSNASTSSADKDKFAILNAEDVAKVEGYFARLKKSAEDLASTEPVAGKLMLDEADLAPVKATLTELQKSFNSVRMDSAKGTATQFRSLAQEANNATASMAGTFKQAEMALAGIGVAAGVTGAQIRTNLTNALALNPELLTRLKQALASTADVTNIAAGRQDISELNKEVAALSQVFQELDIKPIEVPVEVAEFTDPEINSVAVNADAAMESRGAAITLPIKWDTEQLQQMKLELDNLRLTKVSIEANPGSTVADIQDISRQIEALILKMNETAVVTVKVRTDAVSTAQIPEVGTTRELIINLRMNEQINQQDADRLRQAWEVQVNTWKLRPPVEPDISQLSVEEIRRDLPVITLLTRLEAEGKIDKAVIDRLKMTFLTEYAGMTVPVTPKLDTTVQPEVYDLKPVEFPAEISTEGIANEAYWKAVQKAADLAKPVKVEVEPDTSGVADKMSQVTLPPVDIAAEVTNVTPPNNVVEVAGAIALEQGQAQQAASALGTLNVNARLNYVAANGGYIAGFADGGQVGRYAAGGRIRGAGTSRSDSIPAWLSHGEFVMDALTVRMFGPGFFAFLQSIAKRGVNLPDLMPKFANGGMVGSAAPSVSFIGGPTPEIVNNILQSSSESGDTMNIDIGVGGKSVGKFKGSRDDANALADLLYGLRRGR